MEIFKLFGSILIDNEKANQSLAKTDKNAAGVSTRFSTMAKTAAKAGAAVGTVAVALVAAAFKIGDGFDDAFDVIQTGTGASGEDLKGLQKDFKGVFSSIPTEMAPAASAIADLNTLTDATGPALQAMTKGVLEASRVLGEDGAANAKLFGQAVRQWEVPVGEAPALLDKLFVVTQKTGTGFGDLIGQLNTYGPILKNAGFNTEETAVLFGNLNEAGLDVSRIMPALNMAFRNWAGENKDSRVELGKTIEAIKNAKTNTEALSLATEIFGAEGAQRLVTGVQNGAFTLDNLSASLGNTTGAILNTANSTNDFAEKWQIFRNKALLAIEPVAAAVFGLASTVVDKLGPSLEKFATWITKHMPIVKVAMIGVISLIIAAFVAWAAAATAAAIGTIAAMAPVLAPIAVIGAAIVGLGIAWGKWGDDIKRITGQVIDWLKQNWPLILAIITGPIGLIVLAIVKNWDKIKSVTTDLWNGVKSTTLGVWGSIVDGIKGAVNGIIGAINGMIRAWNRLEFRVPRVSIPFVGSFGGFEVGLPDIRTIPHLAKGGDVLNDGAVLVGERGPEVLDLPRGARVAPLDRTPPPSVSFERGAFEGAVIMDDYGVDRLMDRVMERLQSMRVST